MSAADRWSTSDEENFKILSARRERVRMHNETGVRNAVSAMFPEEMSRNTLDTMTERLIAHAEMVRDALDPYDSHTRAAEVRPKGGGGDNAADDAAIARAGSIVYR